MNIQTFLVAGTALAVTALVVAGNPKPAGSASVGAEAPAFTLVDTKGKSHNLSDFKGKYVVLEWTNHQCPFVVKHYASGNMQATQKWATDKGAVWLSIVSSAPGTQGYVDGKSGEAVFKEKGFKSTALLLDPEGTVGRAYGAKTTPHMYVIDPKGKLIYMGGIDDKPTSNAEDIKTAKNYVRSALEEAWAGKAVSNPTSRPYGCSVKYAQ